MLTSAVKSSALHRWSLSSTRSVPRHSRQTSARVGGKHYSTCRGSYALVSRRLPTAASRNNVTGKRWKNFLLERPVEEVPEPSYAALRLVAITQAIPFVGFGFMDNAILIIAGDAIDTSLGFYLGISTLCAAAIGNIISDIAGIGLGSMIEDFCTNVLKLPVPNLTSAQRQLRSVRMASNFGMAVGLTFGCIIGMFPLLFIDTTKVEQMKKRAHLESLFEDVVTESRSLVGAESTCLYLRVRVESDDPKSHKKNSLLNPPAGSTQTSIVPLHPDANGDHLYAMHYVLPGPSPPASFIRNSSAKSDYSLGNARCLPLGKGIVSRAILTGESWNIHDVRTEPDFLPDVLEPDGTIPQHLRQMVVVPVLDGTGQAIAVIRAMNKVEYYENGRRPDGSHGPGFTEADVESLKSLASHISVSLQRVFQDEQDEEMRLRDTIRILKEQGQAISNHPKHKLPLQSRKTALFPEDEEDS